MARAQIAIKVGNDEVSSTVTVEAVLVGDVLAVHRHHNNREMWTVTHVPTGCAICGIREQMGLPREQAVALAALISKLGLPNDPDPAAIREWVADNNYIVVFDACRRIVAGEAKPGDKKLVAKATAE